MVGAEGGRDGLVLAARRARRLAVDDERAVRDAHLSVPPDAVGALSPLLVPGELLQIADLMHIAQCERIHSAVDRDGSAAEGVEAHLVEQGTGGEGAGVVPLPGGEIPRGLLRVFQKFALAGDAVEHQVPLEQRNAGLLVNG